MKTHTLVHKLQEGVNINVNLYDTAGESILVGINKINYQLIDGVIIMYDVSDKESFENL